MRFILYILAVLVWVYAWAAWEASESALHQIIAMEFGVMGAVLLAGACAAGGAARRIARDERRERGL